MNIEIRHATIDDLADVQTLNLELFKKEQGEYDSTYNLDWTFGEVGTDYFKNKINGENGCVLVANIGGEIIGYLCGGLKTKTLIRNTGDLAELQNMFVLEKFRSMGVGQKLVEEFVKWCRQNQADKVQVTASAGNGGATRFYERQGFIPYSNTLELNL